MPMFCNQEGGKEHGVPTNGRRFGTNRAYFSIKRLLPSKLCDHGNERHSPLPLIEFLIGRSKRSFMLMQQTSQAIEAAGTILLHESDDITCSAGHFCYSIRGGVH